MIPTPVMNNLCKRWNLPTHIKQNCDFFFLRNWTDQELLRKVEFPVPGPEEQVFRIKECGVSYEVVWMYEAQEVFLAGGTQNLAPAKYWLSFRSMTFCFAGKQVTKSFALVQLDKGTDKGTEKGESQDKGRHVRGVSSVDYLGKIDITFTPKEVEKLDKDFQELKRTWSSFAERSQPNERDFEEKES